MKFKLLEKFSKEFPKEIKEYLRNTEGIVDYMINSMFIDPSTASCEEHLIKSKQDRVQLNDEISYIFEDLAYDKRPPYMIIVELNTGLRYAIPYQDINPDVIKTAAIKYYVIYSTAKQEQTLDIKHDSRTINNWYKVYLYNKGILRQKDYPTNVNSPSIFDQIDKSGYLIDPQVLDNKLAKYRRSGYAKYLESTYQKLLRYQEILKEFVSDFDVVHNPIEARNIKDLFEGLSVASASYNNLVQLIDQAENNPDNFDIAMDKYFDTMSSSEYSILEAHMRTLKTLMSKIESTDFDW